MCESTLKEEGGEGSNALLSGRGKIAPRVNGGESVDCPNKEKVKQLHDLKVGPLHRNGSPGKGVSCRNERREGGTGREIRDECGEKQIHSTC